MAVTEQPATAPLQRRWIEAGIGLLVICVVTYVMTGLSLDNVPGVTKRRNGTCCHTEFVNDTWWLALAVVAVPIWWVTRSALWAGFVAVAVPTYATFYIASTTIDRYLDSGWGDGLEVLAYVGSVMHLCLFLVAATIGVWSWRRRRRQRRERWQTSLR